MSAIHLILDVAQAMVPHGVLWCIQCGGPLVATKTGFRAMTCDGCYPLFANLGQA